MKDVTVRQLEMANRVVVFFQTNPIGFRKGSPGAHLIAQITKQVAELRSLTATQASEMAQSRTYSRARGTARESLNDAMSRINRTAQAIAVSVPGVGASFAEGRKVGDAKLEARARSLAESVKPFVQKFVDFEMDRGFIGDLESKIEAFTKAVAAHKASRAAQATTTQLIDAAMDRALIILEQLDPIMENKVGGNAELLLKWENVRRVERRWVYKKTEENPETSPTSLVPAA